MSTSRTSPLPFAALFAAALLVSAARPAVAEKRARRPAERPATSRTQRDSAVDYSELVAGAKWSDARRSFVAPLGDGREAELTLDRRLQQEVSGLLGRYRVPYASVVAMDPRTGRILSMVETGDQRRGKAGVTQPVFPAASIFKIVTGAALLEAGIPPETEICYSGGFHAIRPHQLRDDPRRDRDCATLSSAMGKSLNIVFGKLASRRLTSDVLRETAERFFFNRPLPGSVIGEGARELVSAAHIPEDEFGFGSTAAGFGKVYLSPLHGAVVASVVGNDGVAVEPRLVDVVVKKGARVVAPASREQRVVSPEVSSALARMMERTVTEGTARKAFRERRRGERPFTEVSVAGKTGSLADHAPLPFKDYSWFVGFAPANDPKVAISVVVVNGLKWQVKAPYLAKETLRSFFSAEPSSVRRASR